MQQIPYYDEDGNTYCQIKKVAHSHDKNVISYFLYKIWITFLLFIAKHSPTNASRILFHKLRGVHIGKNVYIGKNVFIDNYFPNFVYLEDNVVVNSESMIIAHFNPPKRFRKIFESKAEQVRVRSGAILGIRSIVMPGVSIGECAIVAAGSVIMKNVEPYTMVQGNPGKKILNFEHIIK